MFICFDSVKSARLAKQQKRVCLNRICLSLKLLQSCSIVPPTASVHRNIWITTVTLQHKGWNSISVLDFTLLLAPLKQQAGLLKGKAFFFSKTVQYSVKHSITSCLDSSTIWKAIVYLAKALMRELTYINVWMPLEMCPQLIILTLAGDTKQFVHWTTHRQSFCVYLRFLLSNHAILQLSCSPASCKGAKQDPEWPNRKGYIKHIFNAF